MSPLMSHTTAPITGIDSLHIEEPPKEINKVREASNSFLELLELDPISFASLPETEYEDMIILAPPPEANMASS